MHLFAHRRGPLTTTVLLTSFALMTAGAMALTGCATGVITTPAPNPGGEVMSTAEPLAISCAGVAVTIDFGILDSPAIDQCVETSTESPAMSLLKSAGVSISGTDDYGSAVVCRVNDLPSASTPIQVDGHEPYVESCASMPPEFAYWDIWVKQGGLDWQYAAVGMNDLRLEPGDSIGLVFNTGTSTPAPN